MVEFETDVKVDVALQKVRMLLTSQAGPPTNLTQEPRPGSQLLDQPIMYVNISGDYDQQRLKNLPMT